MDLLSGSPTIRSARSAAPRPAETKIPSSETGSSAGATHDAATRRDDSTRGGGHVDRVGGATCTEDQVQVAWCISVPSTPPGFIALGSERGDNPSCER
eukprot:s631_g27.t1